jgi:hypothetical protein
MVKLAAAAVELIHHPHKADGALVEWRDAD